MFLKVAAINFCTVLFSLILTSGFSAMSNIDPDVENFSTSSEVIEQKDQFQKLIEMAEKIKHNDPVKTIELAQKALELVKETSDYDKIGTAYTYIGRGHFVSGNFKEALKFHEEALKNYKNSGNKLKIANAYVNIGEDYRMLSEAGEAIKHYQTAMGIYDSLGNTEKLATIYNSIGIIYRSTGNYNNAIDYYKKALTFSLNNNDSLHTSSIYNNIGNVYADLNKLDNALEYHNKALDLRRRLNKPYYITGSLLNIGGLYERRSNNKLALEYFLEVIEISKKINDNYTLCLAYYNAGVVNNKLNQKHVAINFIYQAIYLAKKLSNKAILVESHSLLSTIYSDLNLYKEALENKVLEYSYKDSIVKTENEQKLIEMQTKFETAQKEKEIKLLQRETEFSNLVKNIAVVGFFIGVILILIITYHFKTRIKKNKEISSRQRELHHKEQLLKEAELEKNRLKEQQLENELNLKTKQLTVHTLNIIQKNKLLEDLQKNLSEIKSANGHTEEKLHSMNQFINHTLNIDKDWEEFGTYFEQINQDFFKRLKNQFPDLSPAELRLAALIKLNMSIKEAAKVLNISPGSVKTARYRLRKKLNLEFEEDLNKFFITY